MDWEAIEPKQALTDMVEEHGGWVNTHTHPDRSYIINDANWSRTGDCLQTKWDLTDQFKSSATVDEIYRHMARVVENQLSQGVQAIGAFIDCDSVVRDKNLKAAQRLRDCYGEDIGLVFMNQPLKGLRDTTERQWFEYAADFVDIIGGLPERDGHGASPALALERSAEHLDTIFEIATRHDKPLHIHVDQLNDPAQRDTELAIAKTRQYEYAGKVTLVHCISLAAQARSYRERIYAELAGQDISVITCPTAWIDSRRNETLAPTHNAATPVDEMIDAGVRVALGTDNIADIYKPFSDGDMWTEMRFLLESTHTYNLDALAKIATVNGLCSLGLAPAAASQTEYELAQLKAA